MFQNPTKPLQQRYNEVLEKKELKIELIKREKEMKENLELEQIEQYRQKKLEKTLGSNAKPRDIYRENKEWFERK